MGSDFLLGIVIATALAFDFTNGFHDTANAMATSIATGALRPRVAVALSAFLNLVGAFISIQVATTIAKGIVSTSTITLEVIFAALIGAIVWNLVTWYLGLPSNSSMALIGGLVGATLVANGASGVNGTGLVETVIAPAVIAPVLAGAVAFVGTVFAYWLGRQTPETTTKRGFKLGQIGSASLVSLAHGTNDAQKTMGIITLALVAHGTLDPNNFTVPIWVKVSAAAAIALGTYSGGWRIIRTLGRRVTDVQPQQGFAAESAGATILLASSYFGYPLSTTQVIGGAVVGSGIGKRLASVRWGLAGQIGVAWLLTLPAAGLAAAGVHEVSFALGTASVAALIVGVCAVALAAGLAIAAHHRAVTPENVNEPDAAAA